MQKESLMRDTAYGAKTHNEYNSKEQNQVSIQRIRRPTEFLFWNVQFFIS